MKLLLAVLGISMGFVIAVPAHAETGVDEQAVDDNNEVFLADLHQVGISFGDAGQAISAGKSVCGLISRGVSGLQLINDLKTNNPALTTNGAAQFATISAKSYCPKQLEEAPSGKGGG